MFDYGEMFWCVKKLDAMFHMKPYYYVLLYFIGASLNKPHTNNRQYECSVNKTIYMKNERYACFMFIKIYFLKSEIT